LTFTGSWKDAAWAKIFSFSARQNLGHSWKLVKPVLNWNQISIVYRPFYWSMEQAA
jgi:hypothetical protein